MKKIFIVSLTIILLSTPVFSQVEKIEYKIIDEINKTYNQFLGSKSATVTYRLVTIKNLTNDSIITGIEIEVSTEDQQAVGSSVSLSSFGGGWGTSASLMFEKLNEAGFVFITIEETNEAFNFLNEIFPKIVSTKPDFYELYKININEVLEMGYFYDTKLKVWKFYTQVNNAIYDIEVMEGIDLLKKLRDFGNIKQT